MAISSSTQSQAAGITNVAMGRVVTDAVAAVAQTFVCGFVPRYVRWVNVTDRIQDEWYEGMAADTALDSAAAGANTLLGSGGITVNTPAANAVNGGSFTVAAGLMVASKTFNWMAMG
jgi:hypothetical protein